ncbi:HTH domain-containing protein [Psychroflexus sp. YR1-1]|uniref:HTH domain-containing protein n=1 Tax=Psychroflexus aurantiacus TaxID=2709310 RepID=A0A6B3QWY3_9FLAO|nr:HTH domain-containing protein [Psychroflexus aurantiacus]NEV92613.1 HTH domain-containing protein [Psychroflexus aurantiacus]
MSNQNKLYRLLRLIALLKQEPPKSINYIAEFLECSSRTVYRYLELLESVGFIIKVNRFKKYSIQDTQLLSNSHLNKEEFDFLKKLLQTSGRFNKISKSILHKLSLNTDKQLINNDIYDANHSITINQINEAIENNKQIVIKEYETINSQNNSYTLIEPIKLTENYRLLCAFEIGNQKNTFFNLKKIGNIIITEQEQKYKSLHECSTPDAFGVVKKSESFEVNLQLNLKAKSLLVQEYPLTKPLLKNIDGNNFLFSTTVYSLKPLKQFYNNLKNDIKILENTSHEFD